MPIIFKDEKHEYLSVDEEVIIDWLSATTMVSALKQPFDAVSQSQKSAKNKKSKWYGMKPEDIQQAWKNESTRATTLGTWYHSQREQDLCALQTIERWGKEVPIYKPTFTEGGHKVAPSQRLVEGIYPEHFVYLKSAGICGQSDLVEVVGDKVYITDYKTNKEIKTEGYMNWEGNTQRMKFPISHLDDCHLTHYTLQLSLYMYIILKHNPKLNPGKLIVHHILFEEEGKDEFGYPITKIDADGNYVVFDIVPYELPYMKVEVVDLINYIKNNPGKLTKKAA